jgi:transcriptional regulator with XRE-family HTH domain
MEEKFINVRKSDWLFESYSRSEFKSRKQLAIIAAKIQLKRIEKGLNQQEFAKVMGVSQGMISKWESGEYNFSVNTLTEICEKLNLEFTPLISDRDYQITEEYKPITIILDTQIRRVLSIPYVPKEVSA